MNQIYNHQLLYNEELKNSHLITISLTLPEEILQLVEEERYFELDQYFLKAGAKEGFLFKELSRLLKFNSIEHIIAIRQAPHDEEGIWHDDGSRILGFSLSLTRHPNEVQGGHLCFRPKGDADYISISTRPYGTLIAFKTGIYGFEHKVTAVTLGKRIVIAGWCS
jgi:hypothetical protein